VALAVSTNGHASAFGSETFFGSWSGCAMGGGCNEGQIFFRWFYGSLSSGFNSTDSADGGCAVSGSYSASIGVDPDRVLEFRARGENDECFSSPASGDIQSIKTAANPATASDPVVSAITSNSATVDCTFNAAVVESTFIANIQYRKFGDLTWITAGASVTTGASISRGLTGLLGGTTYQVRFSGFRGTANQQDWVSTIISFVTLADAPTVTTVSATEVTSAQATLAGSVDANGLSVRVRFGWGTSDGGATPGSWANLTAYQGPTGIPSDGDFGFQQVITGLSPAITYFFRAFVEWPSPTFGSSSSGVTLSFLTPANPDIQAAKEDHMNVFQYDAKFGVQTIFAFTLSQPAVTGSDRYVTTAPGTLLVAGDVKVSQNNGAFVNVANLVNQIAGSFLYTIQLNAAEMLGSPVLIQIRDQDGPAFRDALIIIRTKIQTGQLEVDASQIGGSANAMILKPSAGGVALDAQDSAGSIGTIRGFLATMVLRSGTLQAGGASSATLDAGASSTTNFFNDDILALVGGTGAGQARVITGYNGASKIATVNSGWSVNPDVTTKYIIYPGPRVLAQTLLELTAVPAADGTAGQKLQFCFQRFAFKIDQNATLQTMYRTSGLTLGSRSVLDNGSTQVIERIT